MSPDKQRAIIARVASQEINRLRSTYAVQCINAITASIASDLMDRYNWSADEVNKLLAQSTENFQNMLDKLATVDDFINWAKERGINIK